MVKVSLKKRWVSTDPWRGYYEHENTVATGWFGLGRPENAEENERIKTIKGRLKAQHIPHRFKTVQTSNVCSVGWDIVVRKSDVPKAKKALKGLS